MNTADNVFVIAKDFSKSPGPRFIDEGKFSGESLREDHLLKLVREALNNNSSLLIDLDGTNGYGTSFLEEAFGGLIREDKFTLPQLQQILRFKSEEEPYLLDDIREYMQEAEDEG